MEITAKTKYLRTSPRKLRLVASAVKTLPPQEALVVLARVGKRAAQPLGKTLKSALSNATNNLGLKEEDLKIKKIEVGEGPVYKRFRAVARGRVHSIAKRTSHLTVVLEGPGVVEEKKESKKIEKKKGEARGTKS